MAADKLEGRVSEGTVRCVEHCQFNDNLQEAYVQVRAKTGYSGHFDNAAALNNYFSKFRISPLKIGRLYQGATISFTVKESKKKEVPSERKRTYRGPSSSGAAPAVMFPSTG